LVVVVVRTSDRVAREEGVEEGDGRGANPV